MLRKQVPLAFARVRLIFHEVVSLPGDRGRARGYLMGMRKTAAIALIGAAAGAMFQLGVAQAQEPVCPAGTYWNPVAVRCLPYGVNPVVGPAGPVGAGGVVGPVGPGPVGPGPVGPGPLGPGPR